ncbi:MAG: putative metal-binding motif-containing protein, partial [Actinomycetota bacterium]
WDDIYQRGGICVATVGTAPNRRWIAEWNDNFFYYNPDPATHITFEVSLSETTNTIDVLYNTMTGEGDRATGNSATIGIQRDTGSAVDQVSYNSPGTVSSGSSIRWTPTSGTLMCASGVYTRIFDGNCATGGDAPLWGQFNYTSVVPPGTSINFDVRTADTLGALATAPVVSLRSAPSGTATLPTSVDLTSQLRAANPLARLQRRRYLQLTATLSPSGDGSVAPTLGSTEVQHICEPLDIERPCVDGASCTTGVPCRLGRINCENAAGGRRIETCVDAGPAPIGSTCAPGSVCTSTASCTPCAEGATCSTGSPCSTGTISCATGAPICAVATTLPAGTACGGSTGNYTRTRPTLPFLDACAAPGHLTHLVGSDDGTTTDSLPFAFQYYGMPYSTVGLSSNGMVSFSTASYIWTNSDLPYSGIPNTIFAFWDDVYQRTGMCTATFGTAPNRQYVVEWNDTYYYGSSPSADEHVTFEVILSETTNTIDAVFRTMSGQGDRSTGNSATIGIQRDTGSSYDRVSYNSPGVVGAGQAIRWTPGITAVCNTTGMCVSCSPGATCALSDTCGIGALSCSTGAPVCVRTGTLPPGTSCGAGSVCNPSGVCTPCNAGSTCSTGVTCTNGAISCASGLPVCEFSGNTAPGTSCGSTPGTAVCSGTGICVPCVSGSSCTASTACRAASIVCSSGAPVCTDGAMLPGGTSCGVPGSYARTTSPIAWIDACAAPGRVLDYLGDDSTVSHPLPFSFMYFGSAFTTVGISSNGVIAFPSLLGYYTNGPLPSTLFSDAIFAFWDDLYQRAGVCSATVGTAPNRQYVVQWNDNYYYAGDGSPGGSEHLTFEIVLSETTNTIDVRYLSMNGQGARASGSDATIGIQQGTSGTIDQVGYNTPGTVGTGASFRWTPAGAGYCSTTGTCVPCGTAEICDGIDNNCNGTADEGIGPVTCGTGSCAVTLPGCTAGVPPTCVPRSPTAEVCDGMDNDCNGVVDDGTASRACY